jgi:hypothetical protein
MILLFLARVAKQVTALRKYMEIKEKQGIHAG